MTEQSSSYLLRGARVVDPSQGLDGIMDLLLTGGKISALGECITQPQGARVIEAAGLTVAPGLIDLHVHLRDPGQTHKEDVFSGCRAAAAGGVTGVLAMPNTAPPVDSPEAVRDILAKAAGADAHVYITACISQGLKGRALCDFAALKRAGAVAVSDDGRPAGDARLMGEAMREAERLGLFVAAHCEDLPLAKGGLMHEGVLSKQLGVPGIPGAAEDVGTARELALAESFGVPVHICHVSTAVSVGMIRAAKRRGVRVTAETAPHYFTLTEEALLQRDADFRMNPPLRTEEDRLAVIEGLRDGTLDVIATDHAPHTPQEKEDFTAAPNGAIGLETSLALGLTQLVMPGRLTLPQLIDKMSCTPARLLGVPGGTLRAGAQADVVLFDERERWTVDPAALHGKSRNTPFKGRTLTGRVCATWCGGRLVYGAGRLENRIGGM
jgi:dihydroorotase